MTLKDINFNIAMYGTEPVVQSTYSVVYTGDESSVKVNFNVTDETDLTGATAKVHLYFADSSHIEKDAQIDGTVVHYTLKGTENDHAGPVRVDVFITMNGATYTRAGYKFRIDASLEASAPLVEYAIETLDTVVKDADEWFAQAQTDFGTAQNQRAAEWVADNDTRDDQFTAAQVSRTESFGQSETDRTVAFNASETGRSNTFTTNENARQAAADANETARNNSYTVAENDREERYGIAESNRSATADADHTRAVGDHNTATDDHGIAESDHVTATADHENYAGLLEDGVLTTQIVDKLTKLETTYAPDIVSVKQQLADKIGGGIKAEPEDLSATTLGLVTGNGGPINLLSIPQNKSVTSEKTNFIEPSGNLIDYDYITLNKYLDNTGGAVDNANGWAVTDFIPVKANTAYKTSIGTQYSYFYDASKMKLSQLPVANTFTTPSNCAYVRFSVSSDLSTHSRLVLQQGAGLVTVGADYKLTIPKQKLLLESVSPKETTFFTTQQNTELTFINNVTLDVFSGTTADSVYNKATINFYAVEPEVSYYTNFESLKYFYDDTGAFISVTGNTSGVFITPFNAAGVRFSTLLATDLSETVFVKSAVPVTYFDSMAKLKGHFIPSLTLTDDSVNAGNIDFMIKNMVAPEDYILNSTITPTDGSIYSPSNHARTGFLKVSALKNYYISFSHFICYYDANKVFIAENAVTVERGKGVYQVPSGSYYAIIVLMDFTADKINSSYVIQSDVALDLDFSKSNAFLPPKMLPSTFTSAYSNMKLSTDGDSITEGGTWQPHLISKLGLNFIKNAGVGGTTVAGTSGMCSDARVSAIPIETELLIIMGGSNDWSQNIVMGTINSTHDTTTFYGGFQLWLDKLYARLPNVRVVIMIPPFRKDMYANSLGLVLEDYRVAIANIAHKYGYPTINLLDAGINQLNATTYLSDVVHPNTIGGKRIAEVIVGRLKQLEPIA